jgi:SAM-dependent methyltransferase
MLQRLKRRLRILRPRSTIIQALEHRRAAGRLVLCNLGCGTRRHPDWINLDFRGDGEAVIGWDLRTGLPFPDRSCDAAYSSHAIEHFDRDGARRFLAECRRVLKPDGILRLVAPDLEGIARTYLECLEAANRRDPGAVDRYEWIVIELLDQLVRHRSGGEMLKYWSRVDVPAEDFVAARVGIEYWRARAHCKGATPASGPLDARSVGELRLSGEVHQWMYDRYSLEKLLTGAGFRDVHAREAADSGIEGFAGYHLDTEPDASVYKPDSFFIEAKAP